VDEHDARRRFAASPVARLATVRPDGSPHVVPVVFALDGNRLYSAVDAKPKRSAGLQRLRNLRSEPRCCVLVDHYDADWRRLWWVRADGEAMVVDPVAEDHVGIRLLRERHTHYRADPPRGPLVIITVRRWSGWSAA
jgi:PPOX class probable F420-dependent enzyme